MIEFIRRLFHHKVVTVVPHVWRTVEVTDSSRGQRAYDWVECKNCTAIQRTFDRVNWVPFNEPGLKEHCLQNWNRY